MIAGVRSLKTLPYRNPICNRLYLPSDKYCYLIVFNRLRIVYQIDGGYVFVDDIQDCRQDEDKSIL